MWFPCHGRCRSKSFEAGHWNVQSIVRKDKLSFNCFSSQLACCARFDFLKRTNLQNGAPLIFFVTDHMTTADAFLVHFC